LSREISVRDLFGLRTSKHRELRQGRTGIMAIAVQVGDELFLVLDIALTQRPRSFSPWQGAPVPSRGRSRSLPPDYNGSDIPSSRADAC
jgi:hypothetical protein